MVSSISHLFPKVIRYFEVLLLNPKQSWGNFINDLYKKPKIAKDWIQVQSQNQGMALGNTPLPLEMQNLNFVGCPWKGQTRSNLHLTKAFLGRTKSISQP